MSSILSFIKEYKKEVLFLLFSVVVFLFLFYFLFFNKNNISKSDELDNSPVLSDSFFSGFTFNNIFKESVLGDDLTVIKNNVLDDKLNNEEEEQYIEGLMRIWDRPVSGYGFSYFLNANFATETLLYFTDSESGMIYFKNLQNPKMQPEQITEESISIPKNIIKTYFISNNKNIPTNVVYQYLGENEEIKTIIFNMPKYFGIKTKISGIKSLPDNITSISLSPDEKKLIYVLSKSKITNNKPDVFSEWYILNENTFFNPEKIFTSSNSFWNVYITDDKEIFATQKESAYEKNPIYKLEQKENYLENKLIKVVNGYTGGSILIHNKNNFFSFVGNGDIKSYIGKDLKQKDFKILPFQTFSKKCTFTSNYKEYSDFLFCSTPKVLSVYGSELPDLWYQGATSFVDILYYYKNQNLKNYDLSTFAKENFDAVNLKINFYNTHLVLINKNNMNLWSLNIEELLGFDSDLSIEN